MESSELYNIKQQFTLGAYKSVTTHPLPPSSSSDYIPILFYQARSHLALNQPSAALALISSSSKSSLALKALTSLTKFIQSSNEDESALEELRDLIVEVEGEDEEDEDEDEDEEDGGKGRKEWEKGMVRVIAGIAFARAGEVEEALETLGGSGGVNDENLEAVAVTTQIYLSISRPDLASKQLKLSKKWASDETLIQLIESSINLYTGKDSYSDPNSFYNEQLANPSLASPPHLLVARGVSRLLKGEINGAKSDLEESVNNAKVRGTEVDEETLVNLIVVTGLGKGKGSEEEAEKLFSELVSKYPKNPLVLDVEKKADIFDELASKFEVPPVAIPSAA
ncbi:coatomer epsilon subunit-domain-containing protein [Abortiporus biennis]|nr:coatomer epsilon subunit-domain-containing protein [Abortiporus biennis]